MGLFGNTSGPGSNQSNIGFQERKARMRGYFYSRKKNYVLRKTFNPAISPNVTNNMGLFHQRLFGDKKKEVGNYDGELAIKSRVLINQGFRNKFRYRYWVKNVTNANITKMSEKRVLDLLGRQKSITNLKLNMNVFKEITSKDGIQQKINILLDQVREKRFELEQMEEQQAEILAAKEQESKDHEFQDDGIDQEFERFNQEINNYKITIQEDEAQIEELTKQLSVQKTKISQKARLLKSLLYLKNLKNLIIQANDEFIDKDDIKNLIKMKNIRTIMYIPLTTQDQKGLKSELIREIFTQTHIKGFSIIAPPNSGSTTLNKDFKTAKEFSFKGNSTLKSFYLSANSHLIPQTLALVEPYLAKTTNLQQLQFSENILRQKDSPSITKPIEQFKGLIKQFSDLEELVTSISVHNQQNYSDISEALAKIQQMPKLKILSITLDCFGYDELFQELLESAGKVDHLEQFSLTFKDSTNFLYGKIHQYIEKMTPFKKLKKFSLEITSGLNGDDYDLIIKEFGHNIITGQSSFDKIHALGRNQIFTNRDPAAAWALGVLSLSILNEFDSRLMIHYPEHYLKKYENQKHIEIQLNSSNLATFQLLPIIFKYLKKAKSFQLRFENPQNAIRDLAYHIENFKNLRLDKCLQDLDESQMIILETSDVYAPGFVLANILKLSNLQRLSIKGSHDYLYQMSSIFQHVFAKSNLKHLRVVIYSQDPQQFRNPSNMSLPKYLFSLNMLESMEIKTSQLLSTIAKGDLKKQDLRLDNLKILKLATNFAIGDSIDESVDFILLLSNLPKIEQFHIDLGAVQEGLIPKLEEGKQKVKNLLKPPSLLTIDYKIANLVSAEPRRGLFNRGQPHPTQQGNMPQLPQNIQGGGLFNRFPAPINNNHGGNMQQQPRGAGGPIPQGGGIFNRVPAPDNNNQCGHLQQKPGLFREMGKKQAAQGGGLLNSGDKNNTQSGNTQQQQQQQPQGGGGLFGGNKPNNNNNNSSGGGSKGSLFGSKK